MAPHNQTQPKLPLITFNNETLNPNSWLTTSHEVRRALENYGCFILSTDKISLNLHNTIFKLSEDLFELPVETKIKNTSDIFGFGYGKYSAMPLVEYFGIEGGANLEATRSFTNLLFPSGNNSFCESVFEYTQLLAEIDRCVMRMVFDSYDIKSKQCDRLIESTLYLARFMKYRAPNEEEGEMGVPPHTDKSFLAILDNNDIKGLEIKMRNGEWVDHEPSPSTFVVLAGDPFMAWSNGRIYAPIHQVMMRTSKKEMIRYTIGIFSFMREMVEVPEELVDEEEHSLQFQPFNHLNFMNYLTTEEGKTSECPIKSYCGVNTTING